MNELTRPEVKSGGGENKSGGGTFPLRAMVSIIGWCLSKLKSYYKHPQRLGILELEEQMKICWT